LRNGRRKTDPTRGFFWLISSQIGVYTIRKKEAAKTRIRGREGHYMGLNSGFFWQIGENIAYFSTGTETRTISGFSGIGKDSGKAK